MPKFHGKCEPIDIQNLQFSISIQFNLLFELKDFFLVTLTSDLLESYWFINNATDWCTEDRACRRNSNENYKLYCCVSATKRDILKILIASETMQLSCTRLLCSHYGDGDDGGGGGDNDDDGEGDGDSDGIGQNEKCQCQK